jgi:colicin import membrane protein
MTAETLEKTEVAEVTEEKAAPKGSFANKAYAAAEKALKDAHAEEFEALLQAEYDKAGKTRVKRRTAEERAAEAAEKKAAREAAKAEAAKEKAKAQVATLLAVYGKEIIEG